MKRRPAIIRHRICRSVQRLATVTIFTVTLATTAVGQTLAQPAWNTQVAGARGSPTIWRKAKKLLDKAWDALTNLPLPGSGDDQTQVRLEKAKIDRLVKAAEVLAQGNIALQREAAEMRLRLDANETASADPGARPLGALSMRGKVRARATSTRSLRIR